MIWLLIASLLWAFSFGLIKHKLDGVDPYLVAWARLVLSMIIFLPFLRIKRIGTRDGVGLFLTGAVQYGIMYITYLLAFPYLQSYEVALFTAFTPIYVSLVHDCLEGKFHPVFLFAAVFAVLGVWIIIPAGAGSDGAWKGFAIMQVSNICFAFGQVAYRRIMGRTPGLADREVFGLMYAGAVLLASLALVPRFGKVDLLLVTKTEWLTLLYLGVVPSGIGFFLWNYGVRRTNPGAGAVMNNAKIPLGILCSLFIFGETANIWRLIGGGLCIAAAVAADEIADRKSRLTGKKEKA